MQKNIYKANIWKIFWSAIYTITLVAIQICATILFYQRFTYMEQLWSIVLTNLALGLITVPAIVIQCNHLRYSLNKEFIITYNSLKIVDKKNKKEIEIRCNEVKRIEMHANISRYNRLPWTFNEYFSLTDGIRTIYVTTYVMRVSDFRLDNLTRRVNESEYIRIERLLPTIRKE